MALLQYLSSLNQSSSGSSRNTKSQSAGSSKSKTRSHSVPHFNQLKSNSSSTTTDNTASNNPEAVESSSGVVSEDQEVANQPTEPSSSSAATGTGADSVDNRSTHSAEQQTSASTPVSDEQPIDLLGLSGEPTTFCIAPVSDTATAASNNNNEPFENITDDEKRRMTIGSCPSSGSIAAGKNPLNG